MMIKLVRRRLMKIIRKGRIYNHIKAKQTLKIEQTKLTKMSNKKLRCAPYYSSLVYLCIPSFSAAMLSEVATIMTGKPIKKF